ncbi:MAG: MerC domain-containing protein [Sphingopyxis sp.]|uniref:MerC domain-containing protein n=1 Tax=Sphingopyxis sp. TaxID=1908224 RepID=UPI002ABAB186|nr:MerC domain-containing protein [Sphingopyxis sp.]MDZ3833375.1 MerC domain-containing protein [Sphingopyxis sp.]
MCLPSPHARAADLAGVTLSLTCLVHCLALPLAILFAPALSPWLTLPDGVHSAVLLIAMPTALIAMTGGWRDHRHPAPPLIAAAGLGLLALGLAAHEGWLAVSDPEVADRWLSSLGALALASAHLINWRLRVRTGRC